MFTWLISRVPSLDREQVLLELGAMTGTIDRARVRRNTLIYQAEWWYSSETVDGWIGTVYERRGRIDQNCVYVRREAVAV